VACCPLYLSWYNSLRRQEGIKMSIKTHDSIRHHNKETYLHKIAKELLYAEIERNSCFRGKLGDGTAITAELTKREDYRHECVLMEFVTHIGSPHYPDETLCEVGGCRRLPREDRMTEGDYRFNDGGGYCTCASCDYLLPREKYIIHDIAAFWKGYVAWAIEIVYKHYPAWEGKIGLEYPVYVVKAENVLKRISDTPVFVEYVIPRGWVD